MMVSDQPAEDSPRGRRRVVLGIVLLLAVLGVGMVLGYALRSRDAVPYQVVAAVKGLFVRSDETPPGQWGLIDAGHPTEGLTLDQKDEIEKLLSLGYAGGTVPRPKDTGVTVLEPEIASQGLRFFVSGHAPEAVLMTREGEILHRWSYPYQEVWAARPSAFLPPEKTGTTDCWRRAHLLPYGEILAIYEGHGLVKLDSDSNLLWSYAGKCHHDVAVAADGTIWVLERLAGIVPHLHPDKPVLLDFFTVLSPGGDIMAKIPLLEAFENSPYASFLDLAPEYGDMFHTNRLELLDGSLAHVSPIFKEGNILISVREMNVIAILDPLERKVVWALAGMWVKQHEPTLLDSGNILLFDNLGHHGRSKVIEIQPFTQQIVWSYADEPGRPLFSRTCGASQRLPGGHTLIVESDNGRALEVKQDKTIVWEYRNPHRAGKNDELIAAILDMRILPESYPLLWLKPDNSAADTSSPTPTSGDGS